MVEQAQNLQSRFLFIVRRVAYSPLWLFVPTMPEVRLCRATPAWTCGVRGALGLSVPSDTRTSEQVKLMTPRCVVVCSSNRR
jgi:hypothetical protein